MNEEAAELIPVRALNQVSYCPRLYYLEYVEAVMPINEYVEDGLFQHRRVNDPDLANRTRKEGDALRTRSVSLTLRALGITGKLDLLEEQGDAIRPVETKRSAAPKDDDGQPTFWENDAIQLCAQGLLVEESIGRHGAQRNHLLRRLEGPRRRSRSTTPSAQATLAAIALDSRPVRAGHTARAAPARAPPSLLRLLAGHHLPARGNPLSDPPAGPEPDPDRRQSLRSAQGAAGVALTRVIPKNDDKAVLYLQEPGAHVGRRSEHLVVTLKGQADQPGADRLDPPGGRLRQRPGLDPGAAHPGRGRGPGRRS